ncbi:MAG TPA: RNA polymerase sigma factor [Vicinamibacterales bacterium]|jgi:RNA polymerase sigma-70 factor (ECF subfamily)
MWSTSTATQTVEIDAAPTDEQVVARVLAGETALFELLMRRYNQRLYRVARGIVRSPDEAEDVVQEAYVNAYAHLDQFANRAKFSTWLTKIAVYEALARARRQRRFVDADTNDGDPMTTLDSKEPDPEKQALTSELRLLLEQAIDTLPPPYRSVFILREVQEMSTAETAACLDVTEDAVKMRLHRARSVLRDDLYRRAGTLLPQALPFLGPRCDRMVQVVLARIEAVAPAWRTR